MPSEYLQPADYAAYGVPNATTQQVQQVSTLITDISAATQEQRDGILEASQSIGQMDSITQQNAALVEQSTAASQSLQAQIRRLVNAVDVFT